MLPAHLRHFVAPHALFTTISVRRLDWSGPAWPKIAGRPWVKKSGPDRAKLDILIARLVVESYLQGGQGKVMVRPRPGTELFYRALGFTPAPRLARRYILDVSEAETLLQKTLLHVPEST